MKEIHKRSYEIMTFVQRGKKGQDELSKVYFQ